MALDPTQDPSAEAPEAPESHEGGYSVTITDNGDGTFSVSSSDSDESQDDPSAPGAEAGPTECQSLDEAFAAAKSMFSEETSEDSGEGEDGNAPIPSDKAADVWNQMAAKKDKARAAA